MFSTPMQQPREQEFPPLLFSMREADLGLTTPRSVTPHRTAEMSLSAGRRSAITSGSVHAESSAQAPPPPILRLLDDVTMEDTAMAGTTPPKQQQNQLAVAAPTLTLATSQQPTLPAVPAPQYEDVWVTIYGFTQADVPTILKEFAQCGDILQWGTFGVPQANFIHIQYQNKYAAQRALLRNGEQMSNSLIIGVKPLDSRHRAAIQEYTSGLVDGCQVQRETVITERPYRLEQASVVQQIPRASRSTFVSKVAQFVLGI